jgi:peptide/nickel transport system permease protein
MRVARYLLRRLTRAVLTLLIMIAVAFALVFPVDKNPPVGDFFFHQPPFSPQEVSAVDHLFYLDQSKVLLYLHFVWQLARGDIGHDHKLVGTQVVDAGSIGPQLFPAFSATLSILLGGAVLVLLLSLPLGALSGSRVGSWADRVISFLALVLVCTHPMMLGLILRSAGGAVKWLPTTGYCPLIGHGGISVVGNTGIQTTPCGGPVAWSEHLVLPWLTFALLFLALYTRIVRANVAETMTEDYVRTARAKGASERRTVVRHVLPSAGLRVLTMVGMEISTAIAVSIYIETAFGINGLGRLAVTFLGTPPLDLDWAVAIVTLITLLVVVGNLVVDVLYAVLDPRAGVFARPEGTKSLLGGAF